MPPTAMTAMDRVFDALAAPGPGINPPISDSSTFAFPDPEAMHRFMEGEADGGWIYARHMTPETAALARGLAALEGTEAAHVTASGMAAIAAVLLHHCRAGDEIVASRTVYGGTFALLTALLPRFGVETRFVDLDDMAAVERAVGPRTRVLYAEGMTNPLLEVPPLDALGGLCRERDVLFVVDNTFAPLILAPACHGADVVIHSLTKFVNGMGDAVAGAICTDQARAEALLDIQEGTALILGGTLDGHRAAAVRKNLSTLHLRMARHGENALRVARALADAGLPVRYPGLPEHPHHRRLERLGDVRHGFGGLLTVDLGSAEAANRVARRWQAEGVASVAVSLGCVRTLVTVPGTSTSAEIPAEQRLRTGMGPGLLRISMGLDPDADRVAATMTRVLEEERLAPSKRVGVGTAGGGT